MKIKIDLSLKILPDDQQVYMIRPGSNYHLFDQFVRHSVVAPDVPFLTLDDGMPPRTRSDIKPQLARAVAYRAWLRKSRGRRESPPTTRLDAYSLALDVSLQSRTKLLNVAEKVLWSLPAGAVIFVPASSLYGQAMIGELADNTEPRIGFNGTGTRKAISYMGRKLHNVRMFPMRSFPAEVTDVAKLTSVISEYEGYPKERILRAYYGDYQLGSNVAMMEFEAIKDKFDPITMARITALAASIENFERTGNYISPGDILFSLSDPGSLEVHANINSANGKLLVEGVRKVPHVLRSLLLVAALVVSGEASAEQVADLLDAGSVEISNHKESARSEFVEATEKSLINFAKASGNAGTKSYIEALAQSSERTGGHVDGGAKVE